MLTKVTEARAKATSHPGHAGTDQRPAAFQKFQAAQGELTGALSRLMVVSENYPQPAVRTRASAICRRSWKAPRTASRWRATATSSRCRTTT